ncbi:MAG: hypothetical protein IKR59_08535 [Lachnospiraceae bacterium]|nr:hypothetical protein [Lachnospiraceae bacterium]
MNKYYKYPSMQYWGDGTDLGGTVLLDEEKLKLSESGKFLADARAARYLYTSFDDPKYKEYWESMGCKMELRETKGEKWALFLPMDVFDEPEKKYPILTIVRPLQYYAMTFYRDLFEMAAQGEFIVICYSSESAEINNVLADMQDEVIAEFHADPTRIYITGHSHYGALAVDFAYSHKERIAGIAQMSDEAGVILGFNGIDEARLQLMHSWDMPLINIGGTVDFCGIFPINDDAKGIPLDGRMAKVGFKMEKWDRIETWKNKMYAMRCKVPTTEEILGAVKTEEERVFGYPADRMYRFYAENTNHFVADFINVDGRNHFRTVAIENLPHATCHVMNEMAWSFLKRFARNLETGEVIELY